MFFTNQAIRLLGSVLLYLVIIPQAEAQMSEKPEIPEEMDRISSFVGEWKNTATFLNPEGEERFKETFNSKAEPILGGRAIAIHSSHQREPAGVSWFFYEPLQKKYILVAIEAWGNYDEFSGNFDGDRLVLTSKERLYGNGRKMIWRRTYTEFSNQRHKVEMYYSVDGGETWVLSNRQLEVKQS